jgi:dCTP deaminase
LTLLDRLTRGLSKVFSPKHDALLAKHSFFIRIRTCFARPSNEYVKLPKDVFATLTPRSSYSRLGFNLSTIVQPGYCGCISLELTNNSSVPVKVLTGAPLLQARFFKLPKELDYFVDGKRRKYFCQVRPQHSRANEDEDISILNEIAKLI